MGNLMRSQYFTTNQKKQEELTPAPRMTRGPKMWGIHFIGVQYQQRQGLHLVLYTRLRHAAVYRRGSATGNCILAAGCVIGLGVGSDGASGGLRSTAVTQLNLAQSVGAVVLWCWQLWLSILKLSNDPFTCHQVSFTHFPLWVPDHREWPFRYLEAPSLSKTGLLRAYWPGGDAG